MSAAPELSARAVESGIPRIAMALHPGTRLGPYEVTALIGAGGMGEVYRATDTNLKRSVAIKVLPESVAADADRLGRFQREAEVLAALSHPNIAAVYGLERSGVATAIVMELVEGATLAGRISQGAIPADEALPIAEVMKSEPDWGALPNLPPAVSICVRRCLKKDPRQWLRDIGEARIALEGMLDSELASAAGSSTTARSAWRWALPIAAATAVLGASITLWLQSSPAPPLPEVVRFEIQPPAGSKILPGTPAISPDGRMLAYVVSGPEGIGQIHLREIGSTHSRPLPGTANASHPFWSPDGRSLAFVSGRALKRIDIAGGPARELVAQVGGPWHGSWNQFGDLLFLAGGVSRVRSEGGSVTPSVALNAGETGSSFPAFLPDGRRFLVRVNVGDSRSAIHLASLDSPDRKLIVDNVFSAALVAPTPRGTTYLFYLRDDTLVAHEFDARAGEMRGSPRLLVDGIGRVANPPLMPTIGVAPSGILAYQSGEFRNVVLTWFSRTGERLGTIPLEEPGSSPSLSPDGRFLAIEATSRGERDVWVTDLARRVTSRLTRDGARSSVWSPDSRRVAFFRSGRIYVKQGMREGT